MKCPKCKSENSMILDSRTCGDHTRRRRKCCDCGTRFSTEEITKEEYQHLTAREELLLHLAGLAKEGAANE